MEQQKLQKLLNNTYPSMQTDVYKIKQVSGFIRKQTTSIQLKEWILNSSGPSLQKSIEDKVMSLTWT